MIFHTLTPRGDVATSAIKVDISKKLPMRAPFLSVTDPGTGLGLWCEHEGCISVCKSRRSMVLGMSSRELKRRKMSRMYVKIAAPRAGRIVRAVYLMNVIEKAPVITRFVGFEGGRTADAIKKDSRPAISHAFNYTPIFAATNSAKIHAVGGVILDFVRGKKQRCLDSYPDIFVK